MFVDILQVTQHAYKQIADARAGRMLTKSLNPNPEIMDSEIEKCTKQPMDSGMEDMDDELRQALLLSMQEPGPWLLEMHFHTEDVDELLTKL